ncbi:MAG: hypothetical protein NXH70_02420 [Hyphomonas sp.]|nr:hypothetical protein [Hyphomonas sp.]
MFTIGCDTWPGISKVVEEAGELGQVCGRLIQMKGEREHFSGADLVHDLEDELADTLAAIQYLMIHNRDLDIERITQRKDEKFERFQGWHSDNSTES